MGCLTAGPGPFSFTTAFIKEVESTLINNGRVKIRDMHHRLAARDQKSIQTPTYFGHGTKATICLEPLPLPGLSPNPACGPATTLMMRMMVNSSLDHHLLDQIIGWLGNLAPPEVYDLHVTDLVHRASAAQDFILQTAPSPRSVMSFVKLPDPSKTEVKSAWGIFNWGLQVSLKQCLSHWVLGLGVTGQENSFSGLLGQLSEKEKVRQFLQGFDKNIALLERVIERNLLAVPELLEEIHLADAIQDQTTKKLGLVRSLQLRLENVRFEQALRDQSSRDIKYVSFPTDSKLPASGSLACKEHPEFGRVLVEYSYYAKVDDECKRRNNARMDHLVNILKEPKSDFHTPFCLGWTVEPKKSRYALIFRNQHDDTYAPITLYEILGPVGGDGPGSAVLRPSLGQRFELALALGQMLLKWHDVGWVHESISSLNVIFFRKCVDNTIDYSNFYLCGFSFSRVTSHHSTPRQREDDVLRDLYQHPTRQGNNPLERHTKEHDIYSFGVLLSEIGFWDRASVMCSKLMRNKRIDLVKDKMLERMNYLGHCMGTAYSSATRLCLSNDFDIQMDDKVQSRLARMFEHQVLRKLKAGTKIDDRTEGYL